MVWVLRTSNGRPPTYDYGSGHFTIKMHHGGQFGGLVRKTYIGGRVSSFDYCHCDELSMIEVSTMCKELGYKVGTRVYCKVNGEFILMTSDQQLLDLGFGVKDPSKVVQLYVEHEKTDDIIGTQASEVGGSKVVVEEDEDVGDSDDFGVESSSESEEDSDGVFHDNDYDLGEEEQTMNRNVEGVGLAKTEMHESCAQTIEGLSNIDGDNDSESSSELSSGFSSSDEGQPRKKVKKALFNEKSDMTNPTFVLGMEFRSHATFRDAVKQHAIKCGKVIKFTKSDRSKVDAVCMGGKKHDCPWHIYASYVPADKVFKVKTYEGKHTCSRTYQVPWVSTKWICRQYCDRIRSNPTWPVKSLAETISKEWNCKVVLNRVYIAKRKALENILGKANKQFGMLYSYAEEIMTCNPGTRVIIKTKPVGENKVKFKRMYICWGALKKGLLEGCRPVICVDGCHLKGPHGGILLTAVGIDANNCIYPFAYAIVGKEKTKTWKWFLELIGDDLDINNSFGWTFMSDKQKGLINAVSDLYPNASHRFCVRHLYNNFKLQFRGVVLKEILWKAARATTVPAFRNAMEEMKKVDCDAYNWLSERPPINWSRSHFSTYPKCDLLLNNLCESFNSVILIAREQPIITMLEMIRHILTDMVLKRNEAMERCKGEVCPKILKLVEKMKASVGEWVTTYSGNNKFEVTGCSGVQYKVDLTNKICGCRRWDLCGIPCIHAVAAFCLIGQEPLDHVHLWYKKETYLKTYVNMLSPINGKEQWTTTMTQEMLPPDVRRKPGRPKRARRMEAGNAEKENEDGTKLSRKGRKMTCSNCKQIGHNKKGCKKGKGPAFDAVVQDPAFDDSGPTGNTAASQKGPVVKDPSGGPTGHGNARKKIPVRRQKKVVEISGSQVSESIPNEVLEQMPTQSSSTPQKEKERHWYRNGVRVFFKSTMSPPKK